jgi:hypothetical protein
MTLDLSQLVVEIRTVCCCRVWQQRRGFSNRLSFFQQKRIYADDYLSSASTVQKGVQEAYMKRDILANANLYLQGWVSKSTEFLRQMADSAESNPENIHLLGSNAEEKRRFLGHTFDQFWLQGNQNC